MKVKSIILKCCMLAVFLLLTMFANAFDFVVDGIYYSKNSGGRTVAVTIGGYYQGTYSGETVTIPSTVEYGGIVYDVTEIANSAFRNCAVDKVVLPQSITTIQKMAFFGCQLKEIAIPNSVTSIEEEAFCSCRNLVEISLPEGMESVSNWVFYDCSSLRSVNLPSTVTSIGSSAFSCCSSLETINLPSAVSSIGEKAFYQCTKLELTLPSSVAAIGVNALNSVPVIHISNYDAWMNIVAGTLVFGELSYTAPSSYNRGGYSFGGKWAHVYYNGEVLTDYRLPSYHTAISKGTFATNTDIESITIPANITTIEDVSFFGCTSLKSVTLSDAVTEIKARAFYGCSSLETIIFGKSIASIGEEAFDKCNSISHVDIGDLASWCECDFYCRAGKENMVASNPIWVAKRIYLNGELLDELIIPSGVTEIRDFAFGKAKRFDKVIIPSSVKSIGRYAFCDCNDLETISFANNSQMESIGYSAFANCIGLTTVTLPNSITILGGFDGCTNIVSINVPASTTRLLTSTFSGLSNLTSITLPEGLLSIGNSAFKGCKQLTEINIPSTMQNIYYQAFEGCTGLNAVKITDLAGWCGIQYGEYTSDPTSIGSGMSWAPGENQSNPLIIAQNLYLNGELITDLVVPEGVTKICDYAFKQARCLTSVMLPEGLTSIGRYAFEYCPNIKEISIPSTLTEVGCDAFNYGYLNASTDDPVRLNIKDLNQWIDHSLGNGFSCRLGFDVYVNGTLLENLVLPERTELYTVHDFVAGSGGLFAHWNIKSATLPKSIDKLGSDIFRGCNKLETIYCKAKFAPTLQYEVINSGYTNSIYDGRPGLEGLSSGVTIYVPVGRLNNYTTNWPNNASHIKEMYTAETTNTAGNLQSVVGAGISELKVTGELNGTDINYLRSLINDNLLSSLDLSKACIVEGGDAYLVDGNSYNTENDALSTSMFDGCMNLESIILPSNIKTIDIRALSGTAINSITIPASVDNIYFGAFQDCSSLMEVNVETGNSYYCSVDGVVFSNGINREIVLFPSGRSGGYEIPTGVTRIGHRAFLTCSSLTSVSIPDGAQAIASYAFSGCSSLTNIIIPSSVTSIERNAFDGCPSLTSVTVGSDTPVAIRSNVFSNRTNATLYVPAGSKADYEAAEYWKEFKEIVELPNAGDANGDGSVDENDVKIAVEYLLGRNPGGFILASADMDGSGDVTIGDVTSIIDIVVGDGVSVGGNSGIDIGTGKTPATADVKRRTLF